MFFLWTLLSLFPGKIWQRKQRSQEPIRPDSASRSVSEQLVHMETPPLSFPRGSQSEAHFLLLVT